MAQFSPAEGTEISGVLTPVWAQLWAMTAVLFFKLLGRGDIDSIIEQNVWGPHFNSSQLQGRLMK